MKKKKFPEELKKTIRFNVLKYGVHVTFCKDVVRARSKRDKFFGHDYDRGGAAALHSTRKGDENNSYVYFHYDGNIECLVHESVHVVDRMFDTCGIVADTETRAYHTGWLVREIMKFVLQIKLKFGVDIQN